MNNRYELGSWFARHPRETILGALAGVAVVGYLAFGTDGENAPVSQTPQRPTSSAPRDPIPSAPLPHVKEVIQWTGTNMFADQNANEVARNYGINAGTFFIAPKETLDKLDAFLDSDLYPIYPPAVLAQQDLIYKLSDNFNIAPNIVAIIMSIESAGNPGIPSGVGAQGLFQVMPDKFPPEMRSDPQQMIDPETNGKVGIEYFMQYCLPKAREYLIPKGYSENHPSVYARALMGYNGGPGTISLRFNDADLYDETRFYGDHMIRFPLILQIAKGLREKGYNDERIVSAITLDSAKELDARAYALQNFDEQERKVSNGYEYWKYRAVSRLLARPHPDDENGIDQVPILDLEQLPNNVPDKQEQIRRERDYMVRIFPQVKASYMQYKTKPRYAVPLSAPVRIWANLGGLPLLQRAPVNMSPEAYRHAKTKRKR